jgi:hypothetical protein
MDFKGLVQVMVDSDLERVRLEIERRETRQP